MAVGDLGGHDHLILARRRLGAVALDEAVRGGHELGVGVGQVDLAGFAADPVLWILGPSAPELLSPTLLLGCPGLQDGLVGDPLVGGFLVEDRLGLGEAPPPGGPTTQGGRRLVPPGGPELGIFGLVGGLGLSQHGGHHLVDLVLGHTAPLGR